MKLPSFLHKIFGLRRSPLTTKRAKEILDAQRLYSEITPHRKPIKEWKRNYASKS